MDMNISMRDKKLLLMVLGVGIFARIHTNNSRKTVTVPMLLRTVTKISPQSEKQYIRKKGKTYG